MALGVGWAVGLGLDVADAKEVFGRKTDDGAAALPLIEKSLPEHALADPLDRKALRFGGAELGGGLLLEGAQQLVGKCPRARGRRVGAGGAAKRNR